MTTGTHTATKCDWHTKQTYMSYMSYNSRIDTAVSVEGMTSQSVDRKYDVAASAKSRS